MAHVLVLFMEVARAVTACSVQFVEVGVGVGVDGTLNVVRRITEWFFRKEAERENSTRILHVIVVSPSTMRRREDRNGMGGAQQTR